MKKKLLIVFSLAFIIGCSNGSQNDDGQQTGNENPGSMVEESEKPSASSVDGIGKFKGVELPAEIDASKVTKGQTIVDVKCAACHKLTDEKLVGPGWKGVTKRRTPSWILNFVTNVDEMLDKDPEAQAQLEICMVRMPNQNLSDEDAYSILEFMRDNDSK